MPSQKRSLLAHFMNTTPQATAAVYARIGDGVSTATMAMNPNVETEQFIHQDSANVSVNSYAPTMPIEQTVFPGDTVFDFIDAIRQAGPSIGANDLTDIVEVRLYEAAETDGVTYPATKWNVAIQIDDVGGDGGGKARMNYTINILGDAIPGTFNTSTLAFTAS